MESLTRPIQLSEISYPVFKIGEEVPSFDNGTIFYLRQYKLEFGEIDNKLLIIDDSGVEGRNLAERRLKLLDQKVKLKKLSKAIFFPGDLIKLANRKSWFIDSKGTVFQYKKTKTVKLVFKRVAKIMNVVTGGSIIEVEGISSRFKTLYTPNPEEVYAGILIDGMSSILYGLYDKKYDDTRRMI